MRKITIIYGLISGTISASLMAIGMNMCYTDPNYEHSMVVGYASMLLAFSLIFVAVKMFRDKENNGVVTLGQAFRIGLYISLIASTMYVVTWAILYNYFMPDFMVKYNAHEMELLKTSHASAAEIAEKTKNMKMAADWYKSPLFFTVLTYLEILPVGLIVSLICALILKKKPTTASATTT
jgi:hypothetical protein